MRRLLSCLGGRLLAGGLLAGVATLGVAVPASAHSDLEEASPGPGDDVAVGAAAVHLSFGEDIVTDERAQVRLEDADGAPVAPGAPSVVDGDQMCAALAPLDAGEYVLDWRVVSEDEHLVQSRYSFEVTDGGTTADQAACDGVDLASPQLPDEGGFALGTTTLALGGGVLVLIAGGAFVWRVRADRRHDPV